MLKRKKIEDVLLRCGFSAGNKGFVYVADAIEIIDRNPDETMESVYIAVSDRRGSTRCSVERCIRHALSTVRSYTGSPEVMHYYMGTKETNKDSLNMLRLRMRQESESDKKIENSDWNMLRRIIREEIRAALEEVK